MFRGRPQARGRKKVKKSNSKKDMEPKVRDDPYDEEIDSDEIVSEEENGHTNGTMNKNKTQKVNLDNDLESEENEKSEEDEDVDKARLRMAKTIIEKAKSTRKKKDDDDDFFTGVERDDDAREIIEELKKEKLHRGILEMKTLADSINDKFEEIDKKPEEITLKGHTKSINCLSLDEFNRILYSGSKDGSIIKWDLEKEKKAILVKDTYFEKDTRTFLKDILCMDLNFDGKYLLTAGNDKLIRMWDTRDMKLIHTFRGHRAAVQGVKFQMFSNNFCSVGCDRTLQLWDGNERAYLENFFGHKADISAIDSISENNMVTCGFDRQAIYWKIEQESQLIFNGGDYSMDAIKALSPNHFVTGSQDGLVSLWTLKNKRALHEIPKSHGDGWVTALGAIYNSDFFISGSHNGALNAYGINYEEREFKKLFEIPIDGVVNDVKIMRNGSLVAAAISDEYRLGRWITSKAKPRIKVFKI